MKIEKEILKNIEIFSDLTDDELYQLDSSIDIVKLKQGAILFRQNDPSDALYVILEGKMEVLKKVKEETKKLTETEAGNVVGEMGFISETRRTATIKAKTDATLIKITKKSFKASMRNNQNLAPYKIIHKISILMSYKIKNMVASFQEVYEQKEHEHRKEGFFFSFKKVFLR